MLMTLDDARLLRRIAARSDRCLFDVVRLALRHFEFRPRRYELLAPPRRGRRCRVYLRIGRALHASVADAAWDAGLGCAEWLGAVTVRFLRLADLARLTDALRRGEDLRRHLEL